MTENAISYPSRPDPAVDSPPFLIRLLARITSYIFHPLFIPVYVVGFLLFIHPLLFAGYGVQAKWRLMSTVGFNLSFLPVFTVFLCWRLKFVDNMFLNTQKERIIPLAAAMIFYFWCWYVMKSFKEIPPLFIQFMLGSFITIIIAWLANIYFKISLHALAVGGMACFMLIVAQVADGSSGQWVAASILIAGAVCSSRLMVSDHYPSEIYLGLLSGAFCQLVAFWLN